MAMANLGRRLEPALEPVDGDPIDLLGYERVDLDLARLANDDGVARRIERGHVERAPGRSDQYFRSVVPPANGQSPGCRRLRYSNCTFVFRGLRLPAFDAPSSAAFSVSGPIKLRLSIIEEFDVKRSLIL